MLDGSLLVEACGLRPDEWQRRLLRATAKREPVLASRQVEKSTTASFAALHAAIFQAPSLVLLLSPSLRQSGELFRRVVQYCGVLIRASAYQHLPTGRRTSSRSKHGANTAPQGSASESGGAQVVEKLVAGEGFEPSTFGL